MTGIAANIKSLKTKLPANVKLVAVTKTRSVDEILEAYNAGQRYFGENKVQELLNKKDLLPADIEWHLIGHLQSNKVKYIVPFINMIQSVDSFRLLRTINNEALKNRKIVDCLLQLHIAIEETKFGCNMGELIEMIESDDFKEIKNARICGLMGMATFTEDTQIVQSEFSHLSDCFNVLKNKYFVGNPEFKEISMGMSGDYDLAVKRGSTMLRIGTLIFGERIKNK